MRLIMQCTAPRTIVMVVALLQCVAWLPVGQSGLVAGRVNADFLTDALAEKEMEYAGPVIQVERDAKWVCVKCRSALRVF